MFSRSLFFAFLLSWAGMANAQKISGTVFSENGDLIPFASITVKGSTRGTSASSNGNFSFWLPTGNYVLVCQSIGYTSEEKPIEVNGNLEVTFILKTQKLMLQEVVVKNNSEDPAYEIIRQAIKKRNYYYGQLNGFSCDLYSKDIIRLRKLPERVLGKKIKDEDKKGMGVDSTGRGIVYLSEHISRVYKQKPDKFKMEISSSRVSGSGSYGFTFPAFISLYTNNVILFSEKLNPRGFISPIADAALHYYKFKFLGTFWEDGKAVNSIRVIPRRLYEPLFSGIINITDEDWRIQSFDLMLNKKSQLELLDSLSLKQIHVPVTGDIWQVKSQVISFDFNILGVLMSGNFQSVYTNYEVNPVFEKNFFDRVVIKYDTAANKRKHAYWDSIRPMPLEPEEQKDYQVRDSTYEVLKDSLNSPRYRDSVRNSMQKPKPWDLFINGIHYNKPRRMKSYSRWGVEALIKNLEYNSVEGAVIKLKGYYEKQLKHGHISFNPVIRYGFSNKHFTAFADITRSNSGLFSSRTKYTDWTVSGGRRVSSFNGYYSFYEVLKNSISTLIFGNNFLKIYENNFGSIGYTRKYENGFQFSFSGLFEDRIPLENTTSYSFSKKQDNKFTPNYPFEKLDTQFLPHRALSLSVGLTWTPGQRYIQFPNTKIALVSKYPTFRFNYIKGFRNLLGSDVDYDKWNAGVSDDKNFKLAGTFKYNIQLGGFLNSKKVFIQDYQHFLGNPTRSATEYLNSFQLAGYYTHSTIASFYATGHVEHHFNGLITNKIPLFRQLNWHLVAGSNAFYVNPDNNYVELFAGIENIFKSLRVDFIAGYSNGIKGLTGIRIGSGGILKPRSASQKPDMRRRGNSLTFSL